MADSILVLNAGSSSIKFSLFVERGSGLEAGLHGQVEGLYASPRFIAKNASGSTVGEKAWSEDAQFDHASALDYLFGFIRGELSEIRLAGVGHRVVHGGLEFTRPVRVDAGVLAELEQFIPLAPLHQPHNLTPIKLLLERQPGVPQVACFDTSFHHTNQAITRRFAIPAELHDAGIRRYGFHGLSYEYIASVLPQFDARAAAGKSVVLHLGNGSSLCAIEGGKSVASTMGFTALEGLPMGTRCGAIDPGVLLYLMDERKMDARAIEDLLYHQSGLLGISGISSDMRDLLASGEPGAKLAVDVYLYRIRRELGSLAAALGGLDALVFTAGIGENSAEIRERACRDAAWLGLELDPSANARGGPRISARASRVAAWVIPTNEELMIARHTRRVLEEAVKETA